MKSVEAIEEAVFKLRNLFAETKGRILRLWTVLFWREKFDTWRVWIR